MSPRSTHPYDRDAARHNTTEEAVLQPLAYADVFDFPLTREEIFRFCIAPGGSRHEVVNALDVLLVSGHVRASGPYICLSGRQHTFLSRRRRAHFSQATWSTARHRARILWMLPFVRMVADTGSLTIDSLEDDGDIDYLLVVEPGRLWLVRALCFLLYVVARHVGTCICPNYLVTTNALAFQRRNLYTARELAQMVPLHGTEVAHRLAAANHWSRDFLPNARLDVSRTCNAQSLLAQSLKRWAERLLGVSPIDRFEAHALSSLGYVLKLLADHFHGVPRDHRLVSDLAPETHDTHESTFSADVCKYHVREHNARVLELY